MLRPGCQKNNALRCIDGSLQVQVTAKYRLWVTQADKDGTLRVLDKCALGPTEHAAFTQTSTPGPSNEASPDAAHQEDSHTQVPLTGEPPRTGSRRRRASTGT